MNLVTTTQSIEIDLAGAVAATEMQCTADWVDHTASADTPGHSDVSSNGVTAATMVAAPAGSTYRIVKHLSVYNKDTANATVTVQFNNNGTLRELVVALLVPGNSIEWTPEGGWSLTNANAANDTTPGVIKIATSQEMNAGTINTAAVVVARVPQHLGICQCWAKIAGAGTSINASWNVTAITDAGTGRLLVHMTRGLAARDYALVIQGIRGVTTYAVADVEDQYIRNTSISPGGFELESADHTATTHTVDDPASYFAAAFGDAVHALF